MFFSVVVSRVVETLLSGCLALKSCLYTMIKYCWLIPERLASRRCIRFDSFPGVVNSPVIEASLERAIV